MHYHPKVSKSKLSEDTLQVTYSTETSRKSFIVRLPERTEEPPPLAIESFAMDPEHYHKLMERVERMRPKGFGILIGFLPSSVLLPILGNGFLDQTGHPTLCQPFLG